MSKPVPMAVARERNRDLRELATKKKRAFMRSFVGKTVGAITLRAEASSAPSCDQASVGEFTKALTDNYLKLQVGTPPIQTAGLTSA